MDKTEKAVIKNEDIQIQFEDEELNEKSQVDNDESSIAESDLPEAFVKDPRNILLPSGDQIQDGVEYLDTALNIEYILFSMHSMLYWVSLAEIFIFAFGILAWLKIID